MFALLADPEDGAREKRFRTLDALESWFGKIFGREWVNPEVLAMADQQMYNRINRSWRRIEDRLIAAELATRVMLRMVRRSAYPCGIVIADRLAGDEEADIERLRLFLGSGAEATAGMPPPATITSVIKDHAKSIVLLRGRHSDARPVDDPDFSIDPEVRNIFSRIWKPSKPVLHLSIALSTDVTETYPGEPQRWKQLSMLANLRGWPVVSIGQSCFVPLTQLSLRWASVLTR